MPSIRAVATAVVPAISAFALGLSAGTYKHFPYSQIAAAKDFMIGAEEIDFDSRANRARVPRVERSQTHFEMFSQSVDIVMVGDSLTDEGIWQEIFPKFQIANRGIWGDTTADVLDRLNTIRSLKAKKAFILLGINDIFKRRKNEVILKNYHEIASVLSSDGMEIHVQSIMECSSPLCRTHIDDIRSLNASLREYAAGNNFEYIDLNPAMTDPHTGLHPELTNDGVHLLGAGYRVWADQIAQYLVQY